MTILLHDGQARYQFSPYFFFFFATPSSSSERRFSCVIGTGPVKTAVPNDSPLCHDPFPRAWLIPLGLPDCGKMSVNHALYADICSKEKF